MLRPTVAKDITFQSSLPPEGECHCRRPTPEITMIDVSILTPPRGGVPRRGLGRHSDFMRFNPHSPPRGSATTASCHIRGLSVLFQSSLPPEGECHPSGGYHPTLLMFQSSLPPEGECHDRPSHCTAPNAVSILTPPRGGVPQLNPASYAILTLFQSSLPPEGECHMDAAVYALPFEVEVSILTPPRGGVPPSPKSKTQMLSFDVSILTPPRGGVPQRQHRARAERQHSFNPHSPPRGSATLHRVQRQAMATGFNPHSPPRGSATSTHILLCQAQARFNPHSPPRGSATLMSRRGRFRRGRVSILTPPRGGVPPTLKTDNSTAMARFNPHSPPRGSATTE